MRAKLTANEQVVSEIGKGIMVLCGITHDDNILDVESVVPKLLKTRLWADQNGKAWSTNVVENDYQILLVSQFTLYHVLKGTKPDFHGAMANEPAKELYKTFLDKLEAEFRAMRAKSGSEST